MRPPSPARPRPTAAPASAKPIEPAAKATGRIELQGARGEPIQAAALSADGATLAAAQGASIQVWDVAAGKLRATYVRAAPPTSLRFVSAGQAIETDAGALRVDTGAAAFPPAPPAEVPLLVDVPFGLGIGWRELPDERRKRLETWAKKLGATVSVQGAGAVLSVPLPTPVGAPSFVASPDGLFVWAEGGPFLRLDTGKSWTMAPWSSGLSGMGRSMGGRVEMAVGPDPDRVVMLSIAQQGATYEESQARLFDTRTGKVIAPLIPSCQPHEVFWSPRGRWVARPSFWRDSLAVADAQSGKPAGTYPSTDAPGWSDDERTLLLRDGGNVAVVDVARGERLLDVPGPGRKPSLDVAFSKDGRTLLDLRPDGLDLWDLPAGTRAAHVALPTGEAPQLLFDANDSAVAMDTPDGLTVIDLATRRVRATFREPGARAISDDGTTVVVGHQGFLEIAALDGSGSRTRLKLPSPYEKQAPEMLAWSSDRSMIAVLFDEAEVVVLDGKTGRLRVKAEPVDDEAHVLDLAFQPGGSLLAVAEVRRDVNQVLVLDAVRGSRRQLRPEAASVEHVAFARDGSRLLVMCRAYDTAKGAWIEIVSAADVKGVGRLTVPAAAKNPERLLDVAARLGAGADAARWLWPDLLAHAGEGAVSLRGDGELAALDQDGRLRLVRRLDGAAISLHAYTFGRQEIVAATDDDGSFDAAESVWPFVRLRDGATVTAEPAEIAKHLRKGLVTAFLAR